MRRARTFVVAAAAAVASSVAVAAPAHAGDFTRSYSHIGEHWEGTAYYTDQYDRLCAKADAGTAGKLRVTLIPANGSGKSYAVTDTTSKGRTCTGNLNIPEDKKYRVKLTRYHPNSTHGHNELGYLYS